MRMLFKEFVHSSPGLQGWVGSLSTINLDVGAAVVQPHRWVYSRWARWLLLARTSHVLGTLRD